MAYSPPDAGRTYIPSESTDGPSFSLKRIRDREHLDRYLEGKDVSRVFGYIVRLGVIVELSLGTIKEHAIFPVCIVTN